MDFIISIFKSDFFSVVGGITVILFLASIFYTIYLVSSGILPILYKLGLGLSNRKICIFGGSEFNSLKSLLIDSKVFKENNIEEIHKNSLDKAKKKSFFLIYWKDFKDDIDSILSIKDDSTALIIYAPQEDGIIDQESVKKINNKRNSIIVNMRGRLLNDILTSLITTAYEKR